MSKTFRKLLLGTLILVTLSPAVSRAEEKGFPFEQTLTLNDKNEVSTSAGSSSKTSITWSNLMQVPDAGIKKKTAVGRGFGDPWNKYAWSMKDINGGMLVGTKNAFYDMMQSISPSGGVKNCIDNNLYQVTSIHQSLACMELFGSPAAVAGTSEAVSADTRFAEIWRFDYTLKTWSRVLNDPKSQGFRVMEKHNNKVYAGSDLGAFITGVDLYSGTPGAWDFPGSRLLVTADGKNFEEIGSCVSPGPCTSASGLDNPYGLKGANPYYYGAVNTSIRSLASFNGKLYVGTFNATGGQLWAYDDLLDSWTLVPIQGIQVDSAGNRTGNPYKPAIMELRVYKDKLYIGVGGPSGNDYLYSYDGVSPFAVPVAEQPPLPGSTMGVIKLFTGSNGLLYIGNVDLTLGFSLLAYDGTSFTTITSDGFGNANNAYAWSMAEFNGRLYLGTFNQDFTADLTSASAQLWYSEDSSTWQKMALPKNFGPLNYGIRNMEVGNNQLLLGTASNMLAPDLIPGYESYQPGAEVWSIR